MPDVLNVVVIVEHVEKTVHVLDLVLAGEGSEVLGDHLDFGFNKLKALTFESFADGSEIVGSGEDLDDLFVDGDVFCAGVESGHGDFVFILTCVFDQKNALAVELPGNAVGLAKVAAVLVEVVAHIGCGAVAVVGKGLRGRSLRR